MAREVFDIVNAGPRHRFTVEGRLVSNCNFGTAYGLDAKALYERLKATIENFPYTEAQVAKFHRKYYQRFKVLKQWQQDTIQFAYENGYVEGLFGRRRELDMSQGKHAENQSINTPIQGSAHDVFLVLVEQLRTHAKRTWRFLLEQHDALIMEVPKKALRQAVRDIQEVVENPPVEEWLGVKLTVPIRGEIKYGPSLGALVTEEDEAEAAAA